MTGSSILISPAEPASIKALFNDEWTSSELPEQYGADFLWRARGVWWGVQRKTVSDFLASLHDGRLAREIAQLRAVSAPLLIIEGPVHFTTEGMLMHSQREVTAQQWMGMQFSLATNGVYVFVASTEAMTVQIVEWFHAWTQKARHTSLTARPLNVGSAWGKPGNRDWGIHILQGFDGIGYETAANIYDHFGHVPLQWTEDITAVKGVGKGRAEKASKGLCPPDSNDRSEGRSDGS